MTNPATLYDAMRATLTRSPSRNFLEIDGAVCASAEFLERAENRRSALQRMGLAPGKRVLVESGRGIPYWIDLAAIWSLNGTAVPIDPLLHADARRLITTMAQASLSIAHPDGACVAVGAPDHLTEATAGDSAMHYPAAILFTSGSTGQPKGAVLSHHAMIGNSSAFLTRLPLLPDDKLGIAIPFHFTSAICHFIACALSGAQLLATERKLLPADLVSSIASHASCFGGAPLQLRWLAQAARERTLRLRWMMSSGDHLPVDTLNAVWANMPACDVYTVYGLTELGGRFCVLAPEEARARPGSVGRPIPGLVIAIVAEDGRACASRETGEIFAGGDWIMDGYLGHAPIKQDASRLPRFATGDLGYLDEDGYAYVVGRSDDIFKVSGQKVSAVHIEQAAIRTGFCLDAAVVPLDDEVLGTIPVLYYVASRNGFEQTELMRALRSALPANHFPRRFIAVDAIPRTGSGKIRRSVLRSR